MKQNALILLLMILGLVVRQPTYAQDAGWQDGCDPVPQAQIAATSTTFDYAGACTAYRACYGDGSGAVTSCQLDALKVLLNAFTTANDAKCQQTAILYASTIQSLLPLDVWGNDPLMQSHILDGIVKGLTAFQQGDYLAAAQAYDLD